MGKTYCGGGGGCHSSCQLHRVESSVTTGIIPGAPCFLGMTCLRSHLINGTAKGMIPEVADLLAVSFQSRIGIRNENMRSRATREMGDMVALIVVKRLDLGYLL